MSITFDFGNISSSIKEKDIHHYIHDVKEIVEAYKKNMFALLGNPGYGEEKDFLLSRLTKNE